MSKLPIISGAKAVSAFKKIGYKITRQRGSHIRMHNFLTKKNPLSIPNHKQLGKGLLRKVLNDAEISVDDFLQVLRK